VKGTARGWPSGRPRRIDSLWGGLDTLVVQRDAAAGLDVVKTQDAPDEANRRRRLLAPAALVLVLGAVYGATLLPGPGHTHDTVEAQFSAPLLCVAHWSGSPTYHLLGYAFSRLVPLGTLAYRMNLLSALFGILACLVVWRLLRRLGAAEMVAWSTAVTFGLTPTFWRFSVVAEVYGLNLLFVALVSDSLVRWRQTLRNRDLLLACAWYVLSFGNHLTMITVLPAFAFFVLATRWRVLVDWKLVGAVGGLILLGLVPYAYPIVRSLDPNTPYLFQSVTNLSQLWAYTTGADFRDMMFAYSTPGEIIGRVPLFLRFFWNDCGVLIPLAVVGLAALADRVVAAYLVLLSLGHLLFALGFDNGEVDNYFIPIYFATAVLAGVGLQRILSSRFGRRVPTVLCLSLPLAFGVGHRAEVERLKGAGLAEPMRELILESRDGALIVAGYNDYMQLLYFTLAEKLGGPWVFVGGNQVTAEDIVAYVRDDRRLFLIPLRKWAPPGLPVYCTRLSFRPRLKAAGLRVKMVRPGVFRVDRGPGTATLPDGSAPAPSRCGRERPPPPPIE
jgi:hypothetical protein